MSNTCNEPEAGAQDASCPDPTTARPISDNVDLVEVGAVLWRGKWLFLAVFLITVGVFSAIGFSGADSYTYAMVLQAGTINGLSGDQAFPTADATITQLKDMYIPQYVERMAAGEKAAARGLDINVDLAKGTERIVVLSTTAKADKSVLIGSLFSGALKDAIKSANSRLQSYLAIEKQYLSQKVEEINERVSRLENRVSGQTGSNPSNAATGSYIAVEVANLITLRDEYQEKLVKLPANVQEAQILGGLVRSVRPVSHSRSVWALLGVVLGIVLGGAAVILYRYIANVRRRLAVDAR